MSRRIILFFLLFTFVLFLSIDAMAQSTSFTYQGSLQMSGSPANGSFDFQFFLYDASSGGTQLGSMVSLNSVTVTNGVFSVPLDFGNQFPGANRFLEIAVRPTGGGAFTTLTPRQPVSSTPYSMKSLSSDTATSATTATNATQLGGVAASQYVQTGDARLSDSRPPTAGSPNYIQNGTTQQSASNFNVSGTGTAGTLNAATQYNLGGNRILSNGGTSNLFAGIGAGAANTTGGANSFFGNLTGSANTAGVNNSFFGTIAGQSNTTGNENAFFGSATGYSNTTGSSNSFFGKSAGLSNTIGNENSFFGYVAGASVTSASDNSFFGFQAGASDTTGFNNSFFGKNAGYTNTTGSSNTSIGYKADVAAPGLTNATAIGANARVDADDTLVLGSVAGINGASQTVKVAIGSTTAAHRLEVIGGPVWTTAGWFGSFDLADKGAIGWRPSSPGNTYAFGIGHTNGGLYFFTTPDIVNSNLTATYRMVLTDSGSVGIGTISPARALEVAGQVRVANCVENSVGTAIAGSCPSDKRFKRDITPFGNMLNRVVKLQPVYYYWRTNEFPEMRFGTQQSYGLIAQEVERVMPELVGEEKEGYKTVDYSKLPLMMLQAIKEQQSQIEAQQKQIDKQYAVNRSQSAEIAEMKALVCRSHRRAAVCRK